MGGLEIFGGMICNCQIANEFKNMLRMSARGVCQNPTRTIFASSFRAGRLAPAATWSRSDVNVQTNIYNRSEHPIPIQLPCCRSMLPRRVSVFSTICGGTNIFFSFAILLLQMNPPKISCNLTMPLMHTFTQCADCYRRRIV